MNAGQCCRDFGASNLAEAFFSKALHLDPTMTPAYHLRALLCVRNTWLGGVLRPRSTAYATPAVFCVRAHRYHGVGFTRLAIRDADCGMTYTVLDGSCMFVSAMCLHALGAFTEAIRR